MPTNLPFKQNTKERVALQGKHLVADVITKAFSVIKLEKNVKKTLATTSICGQWMFQWIWNESSSQLKKYGQPQVVADVFFVAHFASNHTGALINKNNRRYGVKYWHRGQIQTIVAPVRLHCKINNALIIQKSLGHIVYDTMHRGVKCKQHWFPKSITSQCLCFIKTLRACAFQKTTSG